MPTLVIHAGPRCFTSIRDVLFCGNSSYDAVFILYLTDADEVGKSVHLFEVCGFRELDVKVILEEDGWPSLESTGGVCQSAIFIRRWIAAPFGQLVG